MGSARPCLAVVCVLGLCPAVVDPAIAADAQDPQVVFESLFGDDVTQVRETETPDDNVDLAGRILDTAQKVPNRPALVAVFCERAYGLASGHPSGYGTAIGAMDLLAEAAPKEAARARDRQLEICRKQFTSARGAERKLVGEALLDGLLARIERKRRAGDLKEASTLCREAVTVARKAGSERSAQIEAEAEALEKAGPAAPARAGTGTLAEIPSSRVLPTGRWVSILPVVDPKTHCHEGKCTHKPEGLEVWSKANARLTVPVQAKGSYRAEFVWKRTWGPGQVTFTLPVGFNDATLVLGWGGGKFSGLAMVDGKPAKDNETTIRPGQFENGRLYRTAVQVTLDGDRAKIDVHIDGKPYLNWNGPQSALSANYAVAEQGCFGLGLWGAGVMFAEGRLKMLSGRACHLWPGQGGEVAAETHAEPKAEPDASSDEQRIGPGPWIDLLAHVDPAKDAVKGQWTRQDDGLVMTGPGGSRLAFPCAVAGDYRLELQFTRVQGDNEVGVIVPVGARATSVLIAKEVNKRSGLFWAKDGATMVSPAPLKNGKPYDLQVTVRTSGLEAEVDVRLDGAPYFTWYGPTGSCTVWDQFRLPNPNRLGVGAWGGKVVFRSVRLRMLSGHVRLLRTEDDSMAAPAPTKPVD